MAQTATIIESKENETTIGFCRVSSIKCQRHGIACVLWIRLSADATPEPVALSIRGTQGEYICFQGSLGVLKLGFSAPG